MYNKLLKFKFSRKKLHVILLHNELCSESLILCANEHYNYTHLVEMLPLRNALRVSKIIFI